MKKSIIAVLSLLIVAGGIGVSHAQANIEAVVPGAGVNGSPVGFLFGSNSAAPIEVDRAAPFTFVNSDPVASHNMVADAVDGAGHPLFTSTLIAAGGEETVDLSKLEVGKTYTFRCVLHAWMRGSLTIQA